MGVPYAEVIGDPISHSKSPLIHRAWLGQLGLEGDFRATRVTAGGLRDHLALRRRDPDWRGCSVTIPHKETVLALLDDLAPAAREIGAVNCITPEETGLIGFNTDVDGVAAALEGASVPGAKAVLIGAGGAARSALHYLLDAGAAEIGIVVRDPAKAAHFVQPGDPERVVIYPFGRSQRAFEGASILVNASPLGMAGAPPMPGHLLAHFAACAPGATLFDMVYKPVQTQFLKEGEANGGAAVNGLVMLTGQARRAFQAFFGHPAPI